MRTNRIQNVSYLLVKLLRMKVKSIYRIEYKCILNNDTIAHPVSDRLYLYFIFLYFVTFPLILYLIN